MLVLLFHSCSVCGVYCVVLRGSGSLGGKFWGPFELGYSPDCLLVRGTSANLVRGLVYRLVVPDRSFLVSTIVLGGGGG